MFRLLADENFNHEIVRGVLLRLPDLDFRRAQHIGLQQMEDPAVLAWAAENGCIVVSHDRRTMVRFARERVAAGLVMPGLFLLGDRCPIGDAIRELVMFVECSEPTEWAGQVLFLPLRAEGPR